MQQLLVVAYHCSALLHLIAGLFSINNILVTPNIIVAICFEQPVTMHNFWPRSNGQSLVGDRSANQCSIVVTVPQF